MIQHIVLFRPRPTASPESIERLRQAVMDLRASIAGIVDVAWGSNVSPEGKGHGFEFGFTMAFADAEARDAYLPHPAHVAVFPLVDAVAADVLVFDLDTGEQPSGRRLP